MPAKKASISINLLADATKAKAGFAEAEKAAGGLDKQFGNIAKTAVNAFATREIINFGKSAVGAASDLAESANAVSVSFGDAADRILKLGENASTAVGLSAKDFNGFAVQFAGFTRQLTSADKDIVDVTDELTVRIADFASVMNLDVPDAATKFQSALAGSTEPMRAFGIDVSAAAVQTYALENGITSNAAAMTEAEKVQARYGLIMEQTAQMSGDFANTSDGLANSQRILAAEMENAKATIGEALVPVMQTLMGAVTPVLEAFTALPKGLQQTIVLAGAGSVGIRTFSRTVEGFGLSAKNATKFAGAFGVALAGMTVALDYFAKKQGDVESAAQDLNDVLKQNAGFLTDAAKAQLEYNLAGTDLERDLRLLGLTVDDLTLAAEGNEDAINKVTEATKYATEIGDGFFNILKTTTVGTEEQTVASRNVQRALEGYTQALADAKDEQYRLEIQTAGTDAETQRFLNRIGGSQDTFDTFEEDVMGSATALKTLGQETFKTDVELDRMFGRLDDEQALADFLQEVEDANEALRATEEGTPAYEQAIRDRMYALEDLIEAHSLVDSAFAKELMPIIDTGDIDALEAKVLGLLALIGQIAPDIQAAIDAGSIAAASVSSLATQPYAPGRTQQQQMAAASGTIIEKVEVNMPSGSNGADIVQQINDHVRRTGAGAIPITDTSRL